MLSEDFSRCAPGNLLFERTIQRAFADGATTEGKCLTDMTWHRNWRMGRARYERIWLFPRRPPPPLRLLADALLAAGAADALPLRARIRAWRRGAHHPYQTAPAVVTTGAGR